ncbi:hypothetical protein [Desulforamulus aquiferis]|uniref:Uncharacterized protein n=1 Tax=Desulforamulus aquiferis TaxID=1397668 RepID=A0AAW7ZBD1_9FIRM|nr:hypothetical protein [Desulforamulus aquiferis]MDO7786992.1 hypothetical protein [Desulforamulus aquiferis]RYD03854.1 hypothetical protein N752_17365 [Desulforamulus aquiferis]
MESMLEFYSGLTRTELLIMFLAVTAALAAIVVGFGRKYKE